MLKNLRAAKAITLMVVFSVLQVYVQASLLGTNATAVNAVSAGQDATQVLGRLSTAGNKPITINGNSAQPGTTIPAGSTEITTPADTGATIDFGPLGQIDIAPGSDVTINITSNGIAVKILKGCANVTAGNGTNGSVQTAQGTTEQTDNNKRVLNVCGPIPAGANAGSALAGGVATAGAVGAGISTGTILLVSGAAAAVGIPLIVHYANRNNGPNNGPGILSPM